MTDSAELGELAPGAILDAWGTPLYVAGFPVVAGAATGTFVPGVQAIVNGKETFLYAAQAWALGRDIMKMADAARRDPRQLAGKVTVGLTIGNQSLYELAPDEAESVGEMLIGASISAIHDAAIMRHLTVKLGFTDDKIAEMMNGIETVPIMQFLYSENVQI